MTQQVQQKIQQHLKYCPFTGLFYNRKTNKTVGCQHKTKKYIYISFEGKTYRAHRLVFLFMKNKFLLKEEVDHINHIRNDNRWINLRLATRTDNMRNIMKQSNNTSGYTGVSWHKSSNKWRATIYINSKEKHIGSFINKSDAIFARKQEKERLNYHENHG